MSGGRPMEWGRILHNYWLIVVEQGADRQQYQVHQQATAVLLMDLWMRRLLEPGPSPASAYLYWKDESENEQLRVEMRFPSRTPAVAEKEYRTQPDES